MPLKTQWTIWRNTEHPPPHIQQLANFSTVQRSYLKDLDLAVRPVAVDLFIIGSYQECVHHELEGNPPLTTFRGRSDKVTLHTLPHPQSTFTFTPTTQTQKGQSPIRLDVR